MPDLNDQHASFIDRDTKFFMGDPNLKLKQPDEGDGGEEKEPSAAGSQAGDDDGKSLDSNVSDKPDVDVPKRELIEVDRLIYVVLAIENDCQIAPVGSFKMTS